MEFRKKTGKLKKKNQKERKEPFRGNINHNENFSFVYAKVNDLTSVILVHNNIIKKKKAYNGNYSLKS